MGNWIKENKFEAALLGIVLLAALVAFLLSGKQGGAYELQRELFSDASRKKQAQESKKPYPNRANVEDYADAVAAYGKVIEGLQAKLLKFRPAEVKDIPPSEFTRLLNEAKTALTERYTDVGIEFPVEKWHLGFSKYTDSPPRDDATGYLKFQLDAMSWLFGALADTRPSTLINVYRKELPIEQGKPMEGGEAEDANAGPRGRSGRSPSRSRSRAAAAPSKPYYTLPVELTFKAPEPAVRKFLATVISNDQHFFVVRTLRIQNEKRDKAPKKDDVEFDAAPVGGADAFDNAFDNELIPEEPAPEGDPADPLDPGIAPPLEEPAPAPEVGGQRILGQVLGGEEVFVFLELDLILFKAQDDQVEGKSTVDISAILETVDPDTLLR